MFDIATYHRAANIAEAIGLLVNKDSGIKAFADLNGKTIGVAQSATTKGQSTAW